MMGSLSVLFSVPPIIETGLVTGQLQRVGGVIVDSSSKSIVMWLREGSLMSDVANEGTSALANTMTQFAKIAPVIQLGMMVAGFIHINTRLNQLSEDINRLGATILAEFSRDRDTQFKVALEAVHDVFEGNEAIRANAMRSAVDGLREARENFLKDFDALLRGDITAQKLELAQYVLSYAMYAETTRIRCYIISGQYDLARKKLKESMHLFHNATQRFVKVCLGDSPALFLHQDIPHQRMIHFFRVQRWLGTSADDFNVLDKDLPIFEILDQIRHDFWNNDLVSDKYDNFIRQIVNQPAISWKDRTNQLIIQLDRAMAMIENYQRLQGFELELRAHRLVSVDEFISDDELARNGLVLIAEDNFLEHLTWQNLSKPPRE